MTLSTSVLLKKKKTRLYFTGDSNVNYELSIQICAFFFPRNHAKNAR